MMNFQQNLEQIFSISKTKTKKDKEGVSQGHIFLNKDYHCTLMTIRQDTKKLNI